MKITREEIDVICLALLKASEAENNETSKVYEGIRKKLREHYPYTSGMSRLLKQYNEEEGNEVQSTK